MKPGRTQNEETATAAVSGHRGETLRVRGVTIDVVRGDPVDVGRQVRIEQGPFVIGSGESADLRLSDASVSREHVRLGLVPRGVVVRDDGSKNGTWIAGLRVERVTLSADATLTIGATSMQLRIDSGVLELPLSERTSFGNAIGISPAMRHVFAVLERAASSDATVLLEGESGVGKEVLAHAIHEQSARAHGPFVILDCGAIPPTLIESELFGHERGAFTGANQRREGVFEQANGGTLFLDEIGELPLDLQPKLLRVLESREVRPVGASGAARPVDVRIVAATNRRLAESSRREEFRRDLYYRLAVVRVTVPPLRDRPEDVVPLGNLFLKRTTGNPEAVLAPALASLLSTHDWPGNVRELRNVIERHSFLDVSDPATLFDRATSGADPRDLSSLEFHEARRRAIEHFERGYVETVLERAGGVVVRAAELAAVSRPTFYRMLDRARGRVPREG